jgi:site-specific DNA-methyltransferase (adenine-specific)
VRLPRNQIIEGDVRHVLPTLPDASVDCVITSPPYFALRNYGEDEQIGLEASIERWVEQVVDVVEASGRLLKPTGSLWLNLGDSYSRHASAGAPAKSLLLGPERIALELTRRGWTVRNKIVWAKTNPMPSSVKDRLSCTWESIYLLTRSRHYYFDIDAIRVPHRTTRTVGGTTGSTTETAGRTASIAKPDWAGPLAGNQSGLKAAKAAGRAGHPVGKNPGDVWHLATSNYRGAHFATFPEQLVTRPLLASCPQRVCTNCDKPWQRGTHRLVGHLAVAGELEPGCDCGAAHRPGIVLDPFLGAGTVAVAAQRHGRDWLGVELNADYARLARARIENERQKPPAKAA